MDVLEAIRGRRSIRGYLARAVERNDGGSIIADAACAPWTPTSAPDPWASDVITGRGRIAYYGDRALRYVREHRPRTEGYRWADDPLFSVFHDAPAVVEISGRTANPVALEECTRRGKS